MLSPRSGIKSSRPLMKSPPTLVKSPRPLDQITSTTDQITSNAGQITSTTDQIISTTDQITSTRYRFIPDTKSTVSFDITSLFHGPPLPTLSTQCLSSQFTSTNAFEYTTYLSTTTTTNEHDCHACPTIFLVFIVARPRTVSVGFPPFLSPGKSVEF